MNGLQLYPSKEHARAGCDLPSREADSEHTTFSADFYENVDEIMSGYSGDISPESGSCESREP